VMECSRVKMTISNGTVVSGIFSSVVGRIGLQFQSGVRFNLNFMDIRTGYDLKKALNHAGDTKNHDSLEKNRPAT
jgi:hypothetical protein